MEEAESLCDRLAIMDHGRMLVHGTLEELRALVGEQDLLRFSGIFQPEAVRAAFADDGIEVVQAEETALALSLNGASRRLPAIFARLAEVRADVRSTTLTQPSLESLFIKLTGKALRE
jgi:ABC-2 type transport system ATP-binding protein